MNDKKMLHVLYGPPGSGKTAISSFLPISVTYVSVGELFRFHEQAGSDLGRKMRLYLNSVEEYPPELITELMTQPISSGGDCVIVDGFPKFKAELEPFRSIIEADHRSPGYLFHLNISADKAWDRIRKRRICVSCSTQQVQSENGYCFKCNNALSPRDDDSERLFLRRFDDYNRNVNFIIDELCKYGFRRISQDSSLTSAIIAAELLAYIMPE